MVEKCKLCDRNINARNVKVQCSDCKMLFHGSCVNMTEDDVKYLESQNEIWRCDDCKKTRRDSLRLESTINKPGASTEDVMKILIEMRAESKEQIKQLQTDSKNQLQHLENELGKSVNNCHEKIEDLLKKVEEQSEIIKSYEQSFMALKQENTHLKTKVNMLEARVDEMEQYSRINCLEINGIPEKKNEDVVEILKTIGNSLGVQISAEMVDACHRLGPRQDGKKRGIIVKFTRRSTKEDIINKRKVKRNLNTHDLGFKDSAAEVVYINESLSPARRKILNAARALKKDKGYTFVWVRNGRIFLRKNEGDPVINVTSLEQIGNL